MKKTRNFAALIGVLVLFLFIFQVDTRESAAADIVSVQPHFAEGPDGIVMAVEMAFPQGYHAYAHESGDAGRPTTLSIRLDDGSGLPVWYPQGFMQRDLFDPDATVYVYESPTTLFVLLPHEARHRGFEAVLSMLLCSSRNCLPVSQTISGQVTGAGMVAPGNVKDALPLPGVVNIEGRAVAVVVFLATTEQHQCTNH